MNTHPDVSYYRMLETPELLAVASTTAPNRALQLAMAERIKDYEEYTTQQDAALDKIEAIMDQLENRTC